MRPPTYCQPLVYQRGELFAQFVNAEAAAHTHGISHCMRANQKGYICRVVLAEAHRAYMRICPATESASTLQTRLTYEYTNLSIICGLLLAMVPAYAESWLACSRSANTGDILLQCDCACVHVEAATCVPIVCRLRAPTLEQKT